MHDGLPPHEHGRVPQEPRDARTAAAGTDSGPRPAWILTFLRESPCLS